MQIFLESNFGVVLIIDIEVVLFAVFTMSQFQTNYRSSLDRTDTSFSFQEISKQRMSDSSIDVNGEIDLNLNVTGKGGGQIAAIVIGVLVAVICILLILYFSCRNGCKCCDNLICKGRCHHNKQKSKQKEADVDDLKRHIENLQRHIGRLEYQVQTSQPALEYPAGSSGFHQIQSPMSSAMFMNHNQQHLNQNWNQQGQMQAAMSNRTSSPAAGSDKYLIQTQPKSKSKPKSKKKSTSHQNSRIVELPSSHSNSYPAPSVNIIMDPNRFVEV